MQTISRFVLLHTVGVLPVWLLRALRPSDRGHGYDAYFTALNSMLQKEAAAEPTLLLDLDRLDENIALVRRSIRQPKHLRLVDKSLPCLPLLKYLFEHARTNRVMSFHGTFLKQVCVELPSVDILLGKPMPIRVVEDFYAHIPRSSFDAEQSLQWLVDTPDRLEGYLQLAKRIGRRMRVNVEIDVGMHRGGVQDVETLGTMLRMIEQNSEHLQFAGFMGYDAHVPKVPAALRSRCALIHDVRSTYLRFVELARLNFPSLWNEHLTLNGAGSPTYKLYEDDILVNDLSVGSALVKPSDFDLDTLVDHVPALFIATPVLKETGPPQVLHFTWLSTLMAWWDRNLACSYWLYGGYWMARPVSPAGLSQSGIFGRSSNQELLNGSTNCGIKVDDFIFLRPTQSEAVMLQFGDILVVRGGKIVDRWPVLKQ
jgi:D-serine deaminase-like pyridoxal phosphate-dependent protein